MNQKRFGSSQWSVRSESLIAKTVPLSTVTPRHSPTPLHSEKLPMEDIAADDDVCGPLTTAQRAQRLSRLIKQQRACLQWKSVMVCLHVLSQLKVVELNNIVII